MWLLAFAACAHRGLADTAGETGVPAAEGPCGAWSGVARVGTRWTYEPTDAYREAWGFDGSYTTEVATIAGETVTLAQEGDYAGDAGTFRWFRAETWRCDADGAWWIRSEAESHGTSAGSPIDTVGWRTFEPGWLVRPAVAEGWSDAFTLTTSVNGGAPTATEVACDTTFSAEVLRTVGGREVLAREAVPTCTGAGADPVWLAEGIGLVATADEELVAYTP